MPNAYAICPGCDFGVETSTEYLSAGRCCYYCKIEKTRSVGLVKSTLADAEVLLRSSQRVNDTESTAFYEHQIARCKQALGVTKTQESLF